MIAETLTPEAYLEKYYGLQPSDLDLEPGQFSIDEVERLADKYGMTKASEFSYRQALRVFATIQG